MIEIISEYIKFIEAPSRSRNITYVIARCFCGKTFHTRKRNIVSGNTRSCGCNRYGHNIKHGMAGTKEYRIWTAIKSRCYLKSHVAYKDYGGRGIQVCERWLESFEAFYNDMGSCPRGMSIDRIKVDGDYSKENCRWATSKEQGRNKRGNKRFLFDGKMLTIQEIIEETGSVLSNRTIRHRLSVGWSIVDATTLPPVYGKRLEDRDDV